MGRMKAQGVRNWMVIALVWVGLLMTVLTGCGFSDSSTVENGVSGEIRGVAASGAPIANRVVRGVDATGKTLPPTMTDHEGRFSLDVSSGEFTAPYILWAAVMKTFPDIPTELFSIALTDGITHITPMTDLVVGELIHKDPEPEDFQGSAMANWDGTLTPVEVDHAVAEVHDMLDHGMQFDPGVDYDFMHDPGFAANGEQVDEILDYLIVDYANTKVFLEMHRGAFHFAHLEDLISGENDPAYQDDDFNVLFDAVKAQASREQAAFDGIFSDLFERLNADTPDWSGFPVSDDFLCDGMDDLGAWAATLKPESESVLVFDEVVFERVNIHSNYIVRCKYWVDGEAKEKALFLEASNINGQSPVFKLMGNERPFRGTFEISHAVTKTIDYSQPFVDRVNPAIRDALVLVARETGGNTVDFFEMEIDGRTYRLDDDAEDGVFDQLKVENETIPGDFLVVPSGRATASDVYEALGDEVSVTAKNTAGETIHEAFTVRYAGPFIYDTNSPLPGVDFNITSDKGGDQFIEFASVGDVPMEDVTIQNLLAGTGAQRISWTTPLGCTFDAFQTELDSDSQAGGESGIPDATGATVTFKSASQVSPEAHQMMVRGEDVFGMIRETIVKFPAE